MIRLYRLTTGEDIIGTPVEAKDYPDLFEEDSINNIDYEYLKRQHYLATHMELTEENVIRVLEELLPYIEADGGWLEFVEIEHETNFVKVRLGGACSTCAMSAITLKQGIESKLTHEIPDCYGVIQVL